MFFRKRRNLVLIAVLHFLMLAAFLPGCKEGTKSSPVSALLIPDSQAGYQSSLADMPGAIHTISGVVSSQKTSESIASIMVKLFLNQQEAAKTWTTSDGQFYFSKVPPGLYELEFSNKDEIYATATYVIRVLENGTTQPAAPMIKMIATNPERLKIQATIEGEVILSQVGSKLANINVELEDLAGNMVSATLTNSNGHFSFAGIGTGTYSIKAGKASIYAVTPQAVVVSTDGVVSPRYSVISLSTPPAEQKYSIIGTVVSQSTNEKLGNVVAELWQATRIDFTRIDFTRIDFTRTTSDGQFFFARHAPGLYDIRFSTDEYHPATLTIRILEDGISMPATPVIALSPSNVDVFSFNGRVTDAKTGLPVSGADIEVREGSLTSPILAPTETSVSDGFFSVRNRAAGTYYVTAGSNLGTHAAGTLMITINNDGTTSPASLEFRLAPSTFQFAGRVVDARTSQTLNDIKIDVRKTQAGAIEKTVYSAADGSFSVSGFASGTYYVTASSNSYVTSTLVLTIKADGTTSPVSLEFRLAPSTFQFAGRVVDARTSQTLNNIKIDVRKTQAGVIEKTVYSAADGSFSVSGFASGTYYVTASSNSYATSTLVLTIKADGTTSPVSLEFKLYPATYSIAGFVLDKLSGDPINGLTVYIKKGSLTATAEGPVYTSGEGRFSFTDLVPATYFIEAGNDSAKYEASYLTVTIGADGNVSPASIQIRLESQVNLFVNNVSGNIYDAFTNSPLEYVKITVDSATRFFTDMNGDFRFSAEASGVYTMKVSKDGFEDLEVSFRVKEDGTTVPATINLPMLYSNISGYGSIAGRMIDPATELPQGNLVVRLYLWEQVTKVTDVGGVDVTETDYEVTGLVKSTRTAGAPAPGEPDSEGTFNLTNLSPNSEFVLYFGLDDTATAFTNETRPDKVATWRVIDTGAAKYVRSYRSVTVQANKTTFISNYEK